MWLFECTFYFQSAHITSILMEAQSQEEFVKRLEALPKHARDIHEWEGGRCDFHPLRVCTCKKCGDKEQIECEGKPYKTRMKLDCEFHALLYEIECTERAAQASKLVHPILKRGHSNATLHQSRVAPSQPDLHACKARY